MEDLSSKFKHLYKVVSSEGFLTKKSLGGEIPFFIAAFDIRQGFEVEKSIHSLINKLEDNGVRVLEINLYNIVIDILSNELGEGEIFNLEKDMEQDEFKEALQSILDIKEVLMPAIKQLIKEARAQVYFLTGIGGVFPFIRSHNVLNNLQNIAREAPTVMFFPGNYNGTSLELFGLLKDDNYYRAFNIEHHKTN